MAVPLAMIGVSLSGSFPQGRPAIPEIWANVRRIERLGFDAIRRHPEGKREDRHDRQIQANSHGESSFLDALHDT